MVFCSKCGEENNESAIFCQRCGNRLKPEEKGKNGFLNLISFKAIIFGLITNIIFLVMVLIIVAFLPNINEYTGVLILIFMLFIGGLIAGYFSKSKYESGMINGALAGFLISLIFLFLDLGAFLVALLIFSIMGLIGGLVGVFIKKRK